MAVVVIRKIPERDLTTVMQIRVAVAVLENRRLLAQVMVGRVL